MGVPISISQMKILKFILLVVSQEVAELGFCPGACGLRGRMLSTWQTPLYPTYEL